MSSVNTRNETRTRGHEVDDRPAIDIKDNHEAHMRYSVIHGGKPLDMSRVEEIRINEREDTK